MHFSALAWHSCAWFANLMCTSTVCVWMCVLVCASILNVGLHLPVRRRMLVEPKMGIENQVYKHFHRFDRTAWPRFPSGVNRISNKTTRDGVPLLAERKEERKKEEKKFGFNNKDNIALHALKKTERIFACVLVCHEIRFESFSPTLVWRVRRNPTDTLGYFHSTVRKNNWKKRKHFEAWNWSRTAQNFEWNRTCGALLCMTHSRRNGAGCVTVGVPFGSIFPRFNYENGKHIKGMSFALCKWRGEWR